MGPGLLGAVDMFDYQYLQKMPGNIYNEEEKNLSYKFSNRSFEFCQPQHGEFVRYFYACFLPYKDCLVL